MTDGIFFFGRTPRFRRDSFCSVMASNARPRYALPSTYPAFMRFASLDMRVNHASSIPRGPP